MKNPFQYGKLAENENFIDRDDDRTFLKQTLYSGINVILSSPRRWGKSSLVKRAMKELTSEMSDVKVCYIDAFPITSSKEFYNIFAKEIIKSTASQWKNILDNVRTFFRSVSPKISFGPDPMNEFSLSFDIDTSDDERDILSLPEKIAAQKGIQVIVCIDEFQKLAKLNDYEHLEEMMRSVWQHQQNVSYCLYGSQRHLIEDIFNSAEKPFFHFGQMYNLKKINKTDWVKYVIDRFHSTGKEISEEIAGMIADTADCHSWYVQQLASSVWNFSSENADRQAFDKGLIWCVDVNSETYFKVCDSLTELQLNLLRAVACGESGFSSMDVVRKYGLGSAASVTKNKKVLCDKDIISITTPGIVFQDPIFAIWFRQNYL